MVLSFWGRNLPEVGFFEVVKAIKMNILLILAAVFILLVGG